MEKTILISAKTFELRNHDKMAANRESSIAECRSTLAVKQFVVANCK
jgi:hypothetical protein